MRNWQWWKLYTRVKPLLTQAKAEDEMRKMAEEYEKTKEELEKTLKRMKEVEEQNVMLQRAKDDMSAQLSAGDATTADLEEKIELLINQKGELDEEVKDLESRLSDLESGNEVSIVIAVVIIIIIVMGAKNRESSLGEFDAGSENGKRVCKR